MAIADHGIVIDNENASHAKVPEDMRVFNLSIPPWSKNR